MAMEPEDVRVKLDLYESRPRPKTFSVEGLHTKFNWNLSSRFGVKACGLTDRWEDKTLPLQANLQSLNSV
jgi:hypothetical protein